VDPLRAEENLRWVRGGAAALSEGRGRWTDDGLRRTCWRRGDRRRPARPARSG
jgi:hypothetical protein